MTLLRLKSEKGLARLHMRRVLLTLLPLAPMALPLAIPWRPAHTDRSPCLLSVVHLQLNTSGTSAWKSGGLCGEYGPVGLRNQVLPVNDQTCHNRRPRRRHSRNDLHNPIGIAAGAAFNRVLTRPPLIQEEACKCLSGIPGQHVAVQIASVELG